MPQDYKRKIMNGNSPAPKNLYKHFSEYKKN